MWGGTPRDFQLDWKLPDMNSPTPHFSLKRIPVARRMIIASFSHPKIGGLLRPAEFNDFAMTYQVQYAGNFRAAAIA